MTIGLSCRCVKIREKASDSKKESIKGKYQAINNFDTVFKKITLMLIMIANYLWVHMFEMHLSLVPTCFILIVFGPLKYLELSKLLNMIFLEFCIISLLRIFIQFLMTLYKIRCETHLKRLIAFDN